MLRASHPLGLLLFFALSHWQQKEQTANGKWGAGKRGNGERGMMNNGVAGFVVGVTAS